MFLWLDVLVNMCLCAKNHQQAWKIAVSENESFSQELEAWNLTKEIRGDTVDGRNPAPV